MLLTYIILGSNGGGKKVGNHWLHSAFHLGFAYKSFCLPLIEQKWYRDKSSIREEGFT